MRRFPWLSALALVLALSTGCGDGVAGPVQGSYTATLTFVEPTNPAEPNTCCPSPCATGTTPCTCGGSQSSCCPASHCDKNGRHK